MLDRQPRGYVFHKWAKLLFDKPDEYLETPDFTLDEKWKYYTILSLVGTDIHLSHNGHVTHLDRIRSEEYYSKATLNAMEWHYLNRISDLKSRLSPSHKKELEKVAKLVIKKAAQNRESCLSTRQDKIKNQTGKRQR